MKVDLKNLDSIYLTQCPAYLDVCDIQQIIPKSWTKGQLEPVKCPSGAAFSNLREIKPQRGPLSETAMEDWSRGVIKKILSIHQLLDQHKATAILNQPENNTLSIGFPNGFDTRNETLFLITGTFKRGKDDWRADRKPFIGRHIAQIKRQEQENAIQCHLKKKCRQILWIIAEDSDQIDPEVASLLGCSKIPYVYFAYGPTRAFGNAQKNALLQFVVEMTRAFDFHGNIHPVDDDGYGLAEGFELCYRIKKWGLLPNVGLGVEGIEYAAMESGKVVMHTGWPERKFPFDYNALIFNSTIFDKLDRKDSLFWPHPGWAGETEFAEVHLKSVQEVEVPCHKCEFLFYNLKVAPEHMFDIAEAAVGLPGINVGVTTFAKLQEAKAKSCGKWGIDVLPYVSTASVARDMDLIREALGEDVLNYYGFSYGTFLGTVYSQMFPDRVGRLAIDGVMDATTYVKSYAEFSLQYLINTDDIYKGFVKDCEAAGPSRCALASSDLKKHPVDKKIRSLLKSLEKDPVVVVEDITFPTIIGPTEVLNLLFRGWYQPAIWPKIATALASLIDENDATAVAQLSSGGGGPSGDTCPIHDEAGSLGFLSVVCLDTAGNDHPLKKWEKIAKENTKNSEWFGEANTWQGLACKYWPVSASERYTGPWNNKLKNQILIIGNRYDPVTPLASAQIIEKQMEGNGVLLTREGYGHCSTSMVSKCAQEHIRRYFVGTVCDTDFDVFPEINGLDAQSAEVLKNVEDIQMIHEMIVKSN
ncbi:hypothetical protein HDU99_009308, partial [Rhizoclosmatium hyalinum]